MTIQQIRDLKTLKNELDWVAGALNEIQEELESELDSITGDIEEVGDQYKIVICEFFAVNKAMEKAVSAAQELEEVLTIDKSMEE